ncbi:MAG: 2-hydroxychromene-2-carboxylate isomerase [Gammaproteobacteria bacterium]|nr:2-hydroxychromene-2-carboxylate isomerase [Gammaproteobacteria bacterium]
MISYFLSLNSPWTYFGHQRVQQMASAANVAIRPFVVDFGKIFDATGGLPVPKRSKQRQDYRLAELDRWRNFLDIDLNIHPAHWPADDTLAANIMGSLRDTDVEKSLAFAGAVMRAIWAEERNIGEPGVISEICSALDIDFEAHKDADYASTREKDTRSAIAQGVFGAPSYIYRGDLFWGQDRLEFLGRALSEAS